MRNGTQSRLTLVDSAGHEIPAKSAVEDVSVEYDTHEDSQESKPGHRAGDIFHNRAFYIGISIVCAAASIAAASYAFWLTRSHATREALTNVQDILDSCEQRMQQMQQELNKVHPSA